MYMPPHFEQHDAGALRALMHAHPLATWVMHDGADLVVNHVPFFLDATRGEHGTLVGHVARANPVWQRVAHSVFVFHGAQAYVSPSWYPSKQAHGKVVPTWNYAVVHAHGTPRVVDERARLLDIVTQLTALHEAGQALPWQVGDAPADFIEQMLGAIVGIEVPIDRIVGKCKASQNRGSADRQGVAAGLRQRGGDDALAMAALVGGEA